jgi:hypothetical protein
MLGYIVSFVAGMIVMDLMWAFKLGIPQRMFNNWKNRNNMDEFFDGEDC